MSYLDVEELEEMIRGGNYAYKIFPGRSEIEKPSSMSA
jgi:hypothetical protein